MQHAASPLLNPRTPQFPTEEVGLKKKASSGDFHWKNGTSGTRNEYKRTETVRYGDKSGCTEVYNERRVRDVSYENNYGGKNVVSYDSGNSGAKSGYGGGS
ncbi:hypothetical protein Tco_1399402, partial [Tanacetum coccineum]